VRGLLVPYHMHVCAHTHTHIHIPSLTHAPQGGNLAATVVPLLSELGTGLAGVLSDPTAASALRAEFSEAALQEQGG